jgi:5-formyltetrahydrofolate cyclo-ligase
MVASLKDLLRDQLKRTRQETYPMDSVLYQEKGESLKDVFLSHFQFPNFFTISGYWPLNSEIDDRPLMEALAELGYKCALPVAKFKNLHLTFRQWKHGDPLEEGPFHLQQPQDTAPMVVPEVVLIPLLAFDRLGNRLGYGGGFYDRALKEIRHQKECITIGIAYEDQELDSVPFEAHDEKLDYIVTEQRVVEVKPFYRIKNR